jgi:predicted ribosomally synthesized peptide with nif11-like leader
MMTTKRPELTKEQILKAMQCKTAEELMMLAKSEGYDITKEEAEAYMAELSDMELNVDQLKHVAGGSCYADCPDYECDY